MPITKTGSISTNVRDTMHEAARALVLTSDNLRALDSRSIGFLIAAVLCLVIPFEISHLISAIVGIVAYLILQPLSVQQPQPSRSAGKASVGGHSRGPRQWSSAPQQRAAAPTKGNPRERVPMPLAEQKQEVRQPSAVPVVAPTFQNVGWEAEVEELLTSITPTPEGDAAVVELARTVKRVIQPILPGVEVTGFAGGNLTRGGTAFGVAVPEVEIVINVSPTVLAGRLQGRWMQGRSSAAGLDAWKLQKSAIRACTDRLVGTGSFKFRRSAFRGLEPKVTIIAPPLCGGHDKGIPMNLSVNASTPLYNAVLLTECKQMAPRAQELVLLVKRWAKDRGLCHIARGHLSPYTWTLLSIFFLQTGNEKRSPLLPPLSSFPKASELMVKGTSSGPVGAAPPAPPAPPPPPPAAGSTDRVTAGSLFKEFVRFYANDFNWQAEAISVRMGKRAPPDLHLPLHIILDDDSGATEVGPSIEDPFEKNSNLGSCMTTATLKHLRAEFRRADDLCAAGASLTVLLEPWAPGDSQAKGAAHEDNGDEGEHL